MASITIQEQIAQKQHYIATLEQTMKKLNSEGSTYKMLQENISKAQAIIAELEKYLAAVAGGYTKSYEKWAAETSWQEFVRYEIREYRNAVLNDIRQHEPVENDGR